MPYIDDLPIAKLPEGWTPQYGLNYPLFINYKGRDILMDNYNQHHEFIKNLFKSKKP